MADRRSHQKSRSNQQKISGRCLHSERMDVSMPTEMMGIFISSYTLIVRPIARVYLLLDSQSISQQFFALSEPVHN